MKFPLIKFKPKKKQVKGLECLNCGKPLRGDENFCSYCGQKNTTKKLNFGTFINNLFSGFLSYDSRFWTTFIPLLTKPGKVSKEYIEGKRARFVNPFRLYLNVSIIFFLILGISNKIDKDEYNLNNLVNTNISIDSLKQENKHVIDSILKEVKNDTITEYSNDPTKEKVISDLDSALNFISPDTIPYEYAIKNKPVSEISFSKKIQDFIEYYKTHSSENSTVTLKNMRYPVNFWNIFNYDHIINSHKNLDEIKKDGGKNFIKKLTSLISISLFVFLPIFTLFLTLLYFRKNYTYIEHLVFVFNTQTVFFLLLSIFILLNLIFDLKNMWWVFTLLFLIYLYKAMCNFYQQSKRKTIMKFILLNSFYLFLGVLGIVIVSTISFTTT